MVLKGHILNERLKLNQKQKMQLKHFLNFLRLQLKPNPQTFREKRIIFDDITMPDFSQIDYDDAFEI